MGAIQGDWARQSHSVVQVEHEGTILNPVPTRMFSFPTCVCLTQNQTRSCVPEPVRPSPLSPYSHPRTNFSIILILLIVNSYSIRHTYRLYSYMGGGLSKDLDVKNEKRKKLMPYKERRFRITSCRLSLSHRKPPLSQSQWELSLFVISPNVII